MCALRKQGMCKSKYQANAWSCLCSFNISVSDDTICQGSKITLQANINGSKTFKYLWMSVS